MLRKKGVVKIWVVSLIADMADTRLSCCLFADTRKEDTTSSLKNVGLLTERTTVREKGFKC